MSTPIGVVGLGNMGLPMVARLVGAGRSVVALARNEAKVAAGQKLGVTVVGSLAEVAALTNTILLSVPSDAEVEDITDSLGALLSAGSLIVDTSTISPAAARRIAAALAARGIEFVDAPVSGGPGGVEQATLAVMAGGEAGALDRAAEVVAPFTGRFVRCGPSGSGQVAKACNQLVVVTTLQVVSEALVLAKAAGADVSAVREALLGGFAASRILELQGQRMIDRDFVPRGTVKMQRKDVHVIEDLARQSGIAALPAFNVAAANVVRLDEGGGGGLDHSALITVLEQDTGVTL
jgi:2-hydroxy-3-oxopropionate reductase